MSTRLTLPSQARPSSARGSARTSVAKAPVLGARVYVVDHLVGLGDEGPFIEFRPRGDAQGGRFLEVFTSRDEVPTDQRALAESIPVLLLALVLDSDVHVVVDPASRGIVLARDELRGIATQ